MVVRRFVVAVAVAIAVILSAPFAQQVFTEVSTRWPRQFRAIGIGATAVPAAVALLVALLRIRERRRFRYLALALGLAIGGGYILLSGLTFAESFHFVEYGLLAILFYRAWHPSTDARGALAPHRAGVRGGDPALSEVEGHPQDDGSVLLLPVLAGMLVGTLDEWFQWFVPIRAGEARDIALNGVAVGCGLLFAVGAQPPRRLTVALRRDSLWRVSAWAAAAIFAFGLFFQSVYLGYDISDEEIGSFRSRYTAAGLTAAGRARAETWRARPPLIQRRVSREDQYLSEGLWHVQRRNQAWTAGDLSGAWHENRILETFYAPVLDTPSYASASGHRWPPEQRDDAAARAATGNRPYVSDATPLPMYAWPKTVFWAANVALIAAIVTLCRRFSS